VAITGIIGWQVFARYGLNAAPSWTEQAALYLMLWFILFAAAAGVREGFHIRLTMLQDSLPQHPRKALRLVCHIIVGAFGVVMAVAGTQLVLETWTHTIATIGLPRGSAYIPLAASGALIAFFALEHVISEITGREVRPLWS
jgi:TRAP-type C4-dicarboxylate transport system permease small subunit